MKIKENSAQRAIANQKSKIGNVQNRKLKMASADRPSIANQKSKIKNPQYSIRKHIAFWSLTFNGQEACFDHEQGAYYVAYLLLNPPDDPLHGMALALRAHACYEEENPETYVLDPFTSKVVPVPRDAIVVERNLVLDEAEALAGLRRKQLQLERIMREESQSEPVKAEVLRELEAIYEFQKKSTGSAHSTAQKVVRAVREGINHLHKSLEKAVDPRGNPHPVLRPFAAHVEEHLLIPSARYSSGGIGRTKTGVAGCFTYEPPVGMNWIA